MKKFLCVLILFIIALPASSARAQQKIDGIAAIVGNEIIMVSDVTTLLNQYGMQNKVNIFNDPLLRKRLTIQFLNRMIDEKVLLIKADEDTIQADPDRVDQFLSQQIQQFTQQVGSQEALEKLYGMPLAKIKREMRTQVENRMRVDQLRQIRFGSVKISRREVEQFYSTYQDSLPAVEESVDISHILMKVEASDASIQNAFERIEEIKKRVDAGEDFNMLAKEFSEDPSAKMNDGRLGFMQRGMLVKEFEEVAFNLEPGEISDVVQTEFGLHIIKMEERQGEKINVSHILIQVQPTEDDSRQVIAKLNELRTRVEQDSADFGELALEYSDDPNVKEDKGNLGVFVLKEMQVPEFGTALEGLSEGEISEPFRTNFGFHILKLNKKIPAHRLSLKKDWQRIEQFAIEFKRGQEFDSWLKALREDIPIVIRMDI